MGRRDILDEGPDWPAFGGPPSPEAPSEFERFEDEPTIRLGVVRPVGGQTQGPDSPPTPADTGGVGDHEPGREGVLLLDRLREPGLSDAELIAHLAEAARQLDAQGPGVGQAQRRDLVAEDLILAGGSLRIADRGAVDPTLVLLTGSPASAPEVIRGEPGPGSDQYALAVAYCRLRGGRAPFQGEGPDLTLGHLLDPPDLTMLPEAEVPIVARALAKAPEDRWPDCRAFVAGLAEVVGPAAAPAPEAVEPTPETRSFGRFGLVVAAGTLGLIVALPRFLGRDHTDVPPSPDRMVATAPTVVRPPAGAPRISAGLTRPTPLDRPAAPSLADPPTALHDPPTPTRPAVEPLPADLWARDAAGPPAASPPEAAPGKGEGPDTRVVEAAELAQAIFEIVESERAELERLEKRRRDEAEALDGLRRQKVVEEKALADAALTRAGASTGRSAEPARRKTATVEILMPAERAELVVKGRVGRGNPDEWYGSRRVLHTPPLEGPADYIVGAFWTDSDRKALTRTRPLKVEPGKSYLVDLRPAEPTVREADPGSSP